MELQRIQVTDLLYLMPELILVIAAVILSIADMIMPNRIHRAWIGWGTFVSLFISGAYVITQLGLEQPIAILNQSYRVDDFALIFKLVFLAGAAFSVLMSLGLKKQELGTDDVGEYYYFYLPATVGAMIMASSADLIMLFIGLELLSITTYVLVGMRKRVSISSESAFKYIVLGGISSAFILYGMSFLYGLSGSTNLFDIKSALGTQYDDFAMLIYVSFFLIIAGIGFKIAAAPFHAWAPDVYQGASSPVAAYLAVVSKAAGIALLFRIVYVVYYGLGTPEQPFTDDILFALAAIAALAMVVGNTMALRQENAKRLLALSGVANAGYLLVPIVGPPDLFHSNHFAEIMYYLIAYLFMTIGAFVAVSMISQSEGHDELRGFAGLYHRAPWTAVAIVIILLSLAGLPITGGFFGKFFILIGTIQIQYYWLAAVMIITSVISFYFYFGFIRQMFMRTGAGNEAITVHPVLGITLWITVIATVLLGIFPGQVLAFLDTYNQLFSEFLAP